MTVRMLIDARHREETRVAVVKGNRIEEFDFESAEHRQIKGNIYLAKVTRVEPSLQAAFVDYGGNRHGFLAFSEIHPDYYQIPKEDREALLREEAEQAAEDERRRAREDEEDEAAQAAETGSDIAATHSDAANDDDGERDGDEGSDDDSPPAPPAENVSGGDDGADQLRSRRMNLRRRYKIQDVIHRRQVLLVQVVKEERGNKGAALTTYLSLAGRYCVLMPNTTHGGGISRKISNVADRKRLKSIMAELDLPKTMGCIVRTAGLQRTKTEIKRDFDYLARLWDQIRETTLKSSAPAEIHGDSDLIKRAIRDIYNRDIEDVIVEGEEGYRAAREFMKMLMPSHARRVRPYADAVPLFQRFGVEDQLNAMYQPVVQLKSGGYLVINPTEALVSIDINSGRSTREHGIEQTAVGTNLEAAQEIARQLRLRDMAGLVVIDFIDMENGSNVRKVEKAMKSALAGDRARIQVGRISSFGLMEMSRQRLRTGVLEASTRTCPHCEGTGLVRTASSAALSALRLIEDEAARGNGSLITLRASQEAGIYLLNRKRIELGEIERRYGVSIDVLLDSETEGARMAVEVSGPPPAHRPVIEPIIYDDSDLEELSDDIDAELDEDDGDTSGESARDARSDDGGEGKRKRSRRRRGRRGRRDEAGEDGDARDSSDIAKDDAESDGSSGDDERTDSADADTDTETEAGTVDAVAADDGDASQRKRGRRGRRGGRNRRGEDGSVASDQTASASDGDSDGDGDTATLSADLSAAEPGADAPVEAAAVIVGDSDQAQASAAPADEAVPPAKTARRRPAARKAASEATADAPTETAPAAPKPKRTRKPKASAAEPVDANAVADADADGASEPVAEKPKRTRKPKPVPAAVIDADVEPAAAATATDAAAETPAPVATMPQAASAPATITEPVSAAAPASEAAATGDVASEAAAAAPPPPPARRGWWQRTFGSEA